MEEKVFISLPKEELRTVIIECVQYCLSQQLTHQPAQEKDEFLTIKEVACLLRLKVKTVYDNAREGKIPSFKRGNRRYFSKLKIENWIKEGATTSHDEISRRADAYLTTRTKKIK